MNIINFIKEYWVQILFFSGILSSMLVLVRTSIEGTKCSLRNDILSIYDKCKKDKKISLYDLQAIEYSSKLYFKLKGNSFVKDIIEEVKLFERID